MQESLTISGTVVNLSPSIYSPTGRDNITDALIIVLTNSIRIAITDTPTSSTGIKFSAGESFKLSSFYDISHLKMISTGDGDADISVIYGDVTLKSMSSSSSGSGGSTLPIADTTSVVKDPVDATKQVRLTAENVATDTTVVIKAPSTDLDLENPVFNNAPDAPGYKVNGDSIATEHLVVSTDLNFVTDAQLTLIDDSLQPDDVGVVNGICELDSNTKVPNNRIHTGEASGICELDSNTKVPNNRIHTGEASGVCELDSNTKVPISRLPSSVVGGMKYQGSWDANANDPTLPAADSSNQGFYYVVSTAGATDIDGETDWNIGDFIVSNGTTWDKIDNTDKVTSVFSRTGTVTAQSGDYTADQITETTTNKIMTSTERTKLAALAFSFGTVGAKTISSGAVTVTEFNASIAVESGSIDDLDTITKSGVADGDPLRIYRADSTKPIWITENGNILTPDGKFYILPPKTGALLIWNASASKWQLMAIPKILWEDITVTYTSSLTATQIQTDFDARINGTQAGVGNYTLTAQFSDGTYALTSTLNARNVGCKLLITGNQSESGLHNNQAVELDCDITGPCILVENCTYAIVQNLKISLADNGSTNAIQVLSSRCDIYGGYYISDGGACDLLYYEGRSLSETWNNYLEHGYRAIQVQFGSFVASRNNNTTGTQATYGISSYGIVTRESTQPTGSTANTNTYGGGQIF